MTIVSTSTPWVSFAKSWTVDIPGTVGGQSAFVGFTGGTGTYTGIQDVLAWTFYTPNSVATRAATTTSLSSLPKSSTSNQPITFTATVSSASGTPTGTVNFQDGPTILKTETLDSSGTATLTISSLGVGSHIVTAVYSGDSLFAPSTSDNLTEVVNPPFTITPSLETKTINAGQNADFQLSLTPQNGSTVNVALTCSVLPAVPTCGIQPDSIALSGSGPFVAVASISTVSHTSAWWKEPLALPGLVGFMGIVVVFRKNARRLGSTATMVFLVIAILSCGGGSGDTSSQKAASGGTPSGTYTVTVTGTSGSYSQAITVTVVVQ